ncbi:MAG TPA: cupin domain-containing protein [Kiloniellaceae bacterium]|nr:cupin domain-containing protein [Kiloniellaceae bacterium]
MERKSQRAVVDPRDVPIEAWNDKAQGEVRWRTLISADRTDSSALVCGLAYFDAGHCLALHHHAEPEVVHVVRGSGYACIDGETAALREGTTIFVGSGVPHRWTAGKDGMVLFFTLAASSFQDIDYRFPGRA